MADNLYERHFYTNKNIDMLVNQEIIEYDMKSAGLAICEEFGYLDKKTIERLKIMDKHHRVVTMGKLKKKDKQLSKNENQGFIESRKLFFKSNNLSVDDVIAIKRDAVFVTRRCNQRKFGKIEFAVKNIYTSYLYLDGLELYYNNRTIDVKGINDDIIHKHDGYMMDFFKKYFMLLETNNRSKLVEYVTNFVYRYKSRLLDEGYYREFNASSLYRLQEQIENKYYGVDMLDSDGSTLTLKDVNITYNYFNFLVPICTGLI